MHFIRTNYSKKITLADIAAYSHVSPRYLQKVFQEWLDVTPIEFLNQYRLYMLHKNLKKYDNVHDAAMSVGLTHMGRASGNFKKLFNKSPIRVLKEKR